MNAEDKKDFSSDQDYDRIKNRDISTEMKESFLDYSMSVIVSRALPDVKDGLKPVHRRILYAMSGLGMTNDKPTRKSALLVGEVMGNYHPHGDSAIYASMVRMAQAFSYRYPLVQGQGNFGNIDGWPAASMRYTEAKMSKITAEMLRDINKNTVDFIDNYSQEKKEPVVLPSRVPNLLMNGSMGIAVGMATNIPPHNLNELVDGLVALMEDPDLTNLELMQNYIFGPDFPTGSYILGRSGIKKAYLTGRGSIIQRGKAEVMTLANGKPQIVITEIPYQVVKASLVEKIASLVKEKQIEGITDIRDESSNRTGIRVVIECRKDVSGEVVLNQLYRLTPLQTSFGANMIALVNGVPRLLSLKDMLQYYLDHQKDVITRRSQFDLDKAKDRLHILEGFVIALDHIDEIISIIRSSKDDSESIQRFYDRFKLTEIQSKAILAMQLRRLSGLERLKLHQEYEETQKLIDDLEDILANPHRVLAIIRDDLLEIKQKYGDPRKSVILDSGYDVDDEDLIERESIVVTMTKSGYIKQTPTDEYQTQNRGGKGVKSMSVHEDDLVDNLLTMNTHDYILFFTNTGRVFRLKGYQIPQAKRTAKGLPIVNLLELEENERICSLLSVTDDHEGVEYAIFVTKNGLFKKTPVEEFFNINRRGKIAIKLRENDQLVRCLASGGKDEILIAASNSRVVRFNEEDVRPQGRNASGVKAIDVSDGCQVVDMATNAYGNKVLVVTENGFGKMTDIEEYRLTRRGSKGVLTLKTTAKTGNLVGFKVVGGEEDLVIVTNEGVMIRISLTNVSTLSRNTQGVTLMRMDDSKVVEIAVIHDDYEEEEESNH